MIRTLPSIRFFACIAVALHLVLILSLPYWIEQTKVPPAKPRKIAVQTVALSPKKAANVQVTKPVVESPPLPQPVKETVVAEAPPQPQEAPKPKPEKKEAPKVQEKKAAAPQKKQEPIKKEAPAKKSISSKPTKNSANKKKEVKKQPVSKKPAKPTPVTKPTPAKSNPKNAIKATKVKAAAEKQQALIASAQKAVSQISSGKQKNIETTSDDQISTSLSQIKNLEIGSSVSYAEETFTGQELTYYQELASRIKMQLRLPKYGEVQVKLTLKRSGQFVRLKVEHAENGENRKYIENKLPSLTYPAFGDNFSDQEQYTFLLSLSNEL